MFDTLEQQLADSQAREAALQSQVAALVEWIKAIPQKACYHSCDSNAMESPCDCALEQHANELLANLPEAGKAWEQKVRAEAAKEERARCVEAAERCEPVERCQAIHNGPDCICKKAIIKTHIIEAIQAIEPDAGEGSNV